VAKRTHVRTSGVEGDFTYRTPITGLTLNGAFNYNKGKYLDYQASCYRGQSSTTCFPQVNRLTGQVALQQDLSGTELVRAPKWTFDAGFDYQRPVTDALSLGLAANLSHSDSYFAAPTSSPGTPSPGSRACSGPGWPLPPSTSRATATRASTRTWTYR